MAGDDLVGKVIESRYRVESLLGRGGMGVVYQGRHVAIDRAVAIKVLNPILSTSPEMVRRFEREARAAAALNHPNLVPVVDFGSLENGTLFLIMEFIKGLSLAQTLKQEQRFEPVRALSITRHVLRGLGHAHRQGIVHRDIKPDNVMLVALADEKDFARVLDFGIAQLRDGDGSDRLTQAGVAVGTPAYLSPEQASGSPVDRRADLYSTAVMLFEMLTGRPPFIGATPLAVLSKHTTEMPPRASSLRPDLSGYAGLDGLLEKGLAKMPDDRFASAEEFIAALDAAAAMVPATAGASPAAAVGTLGVAPTMFASSGAMTPAPSSATMAATPGALAVGSPMPAHTGQAGAPVYTPAPGSATAGAQPDLASYTPAPAAMTSAGESSEKRPRWWPYALAALFAVGLVTVAIVASSKADRGELIKENIALLKDGETCEDRRGAVLALRELRAKEALPALKRARRRMRGGLFGVGAKNQNRCLKKEADETIEYLESLPE